jgi:hypothetical protein
VSWALPWLLIVTVIVIALLVAIQMVGDDPVRTSGPQDASAQASPEPTETAAPNDQENEAESSDEQPEKDKKKKEPPRDPTDQPESDLVTKGVTVQVLNGSGDAAADDLMADKLARLGYTVVAVSPAVRAYPQTVVFWVGDGRGAATALAERFEWRAEPAPGNLSQEVDLHVVVGAS